MSFNFKHTHISAITALVSFVALRDQRHHRFSHASRCVQRLPGRRLDYVTAACLLVVVVKSWAGLFTFFGNWYPGDKAFGN